MAESVSWIWRKVDSLPEPISDFRGSPMHNPSGVSSWDPWSYGFPEPNPPPPISPSSSYGADYWGYRDPPPPPISLPSSYRADYWGYGDPSPTSPVSSSILPPPMSYYYGNPPNVFPTPSNHRECPMNTPSAYSYSRNQGYGFYPDSMDVGGRCGYEIETVDRAREREGIGVLSGDERQERDSDYGRQERDSLNLAELRQMVKDLGRCQEKMESEVKASFEEASQESEESVATAMIEYPKQDSVDSATTVTESDELKVDAKANWEVAYQEEIEGRVENVNEEIDSSPQIDDILPCDFCKMEVVPIEDPIQKVDEDPGDFHIKQESLEVYFHPLQNLVNSDNMINRIIEIEMGSIGFQKCLSKNQGYVENSRQCRELWGEVCKNSEAFAVAHTMFDKMPRSVKGDQLQKTLGFDPGIISSYAHKVFVKMSAQYVSLNLDETGIAETMFVGRLVKGVQLQIVLVNEGISTSSENKRDIVIAYGCTYPIVFDPGKIEGWDCGVYSHALDFKVGEGSKNAFPYDRGKKGLVACFWMIIDSCMEWVGARNLLSTQVVLIHTVLDGLVRIYQ